MTSALVIATQAGGLSDSVLTFEELVENWLIYLETHKNRAQKTIATYRKALLGGENGSSNLPFAKWLKAHGVDAPTKQDVADWRAALNKAGLSAASKNLYMSALRSFCRWLNKKFGFVDIAADFDNWHVDKSHKRDFLPAPQMKMTFDAVKLNSDIKGSVRSERRRLQFLRDRAIIAVLLTCGLRTVEIERLRICDFATHGGAPVLAVEGKGKSGSRVDVKVCKETASVIGAWLIERKHLPGVDEKSPLFCSLSNNSFGERLSSNSVSTLVSKYLKSAGLKTARLTAHSLRHSYATHAILAGANLREVQQALRHANASTTEGYLHDISTLTNRCSDFAAAAIF